MKKTVLSIKGEDFYINGRKIYSELSDNEACHGLLMNARFIQGIFDDKKDRERFNRFGRQFNADQNTDSLISALSEWYKYGLRAFTVGLQGGGPCFTINNDTIENNPFDEQGNSIDVKYTERLNRLICAADELGMIVIVSFFYPGQVNKLKDGKTIANAVRTVSRFLKDKGYTNVIIEVCNEMDIDRVHPILHEPEGMSLLIDIAKEESGGLYVGCSCGGGSSYKEVSKASDVIFIHGNGCSRQNYYNLIHRVKAHSPGKPVVCNEDSQAIGQLKVSFDTHTSWGYYNNMTKQEPPADWSVTKGEDLFFAYRMAQGLGLKIPTVPFEEQFYFQGLEKDMTYQGKRWLRVASLYPELIDFVEFFCNKTKVYTCYDEPFSLFFQGNWMQGGWKVEGNEDWQAKIYLRDGKIIIKEGFCTNAVNS